MRILAGSGVPLAWCEASPGLPAQWRCAYVPFCKSCSMIWRKKLLCLPVTVVLVGVGEGVLMLLILDVCSGGVARTAQSDEHIA